MENIVSTESMKPEEIDYMKRRLGIDHDKQLYPSRFSSETSISRRLGGLAIPLTELGRILAKEKEDKQIEEENNSGFGYV